MTNIRTHMSEIYCLFTRGRGLSEQARNLLYLTAHFMVSKGKESQPIKKHGLVGKLTTRGECTGLGGTYGQKFRAELDSEEFGRQTAEFIVNIHKKPSRGEWMSISEEFADAIMKVSSN